MIIYDDWAEEMSNLKLETVQHDKSNTPLVTCKSRRSSSSLDREHQPNHGKLQKTQSTRRIAQSQARSAKTTHRLICE